MPAAAFGTEPHLKLSGLAITYAEALERLSRNKDAYEVYLDALQRIRHAHAPNLAAPAPHFQPMPRPTPRERMRAVALASKLGELAGNNAGAREQEEAHLTFAVEEMLRVAREVGVEPRASAFALLVGAGDDKKIKPEDEDAKVVLTDLDLPTWVSKADVGAPLEALAEYYTRTGRYE
jgi:phage terminase small subunit